MTRGGFILYHSSALFFVNAESIGLEPRLFLVVEVENVEVENWLWICVSFNTRLSRSSQKI